MDVEDTIMTSIGGANVTQTFEGRQRFPVNVRCGRELRTDHARLQRVLGPGSIRGEAAGIALRERRVTKDYPPLPDESSHAAPA